MPSFWMISEDAGECDVCRQHQADLMHDMRELHHEVTRLQEFSAPG